MAKDVAVRQETAVAVSAGFDYGEDAGAGFEGLSSSDLSIPFLAVLQPSSPPVLDEVPGAVVGALYNTVSGEVFPADYGVPFQPVYREHVYTEWRPRNAGGGLVARHEPDSQEVADSKARLLAETGKDFGKMKIGENELVETYYVYGLILSKDLSQVDGFAVLSFKSTGIKGYRNWITNMRMLRGKPPLFANRVLLKGKKEKNDQGTFANFKIEPAKGTYLASLIDPATESSLLVEAKAFLDMVLSGRAKAAFETEAAETADGSAAAGGAPLTDEEIPF